MLGDALGLEYRCATTARNDVVITGEGGRRLVVADVLFAAAEQLLDPRVLPALPLAVCPRAAFPGAAVLGDLPVVYGRELPDRGYVSETPDTIELGIDLFGTAFALLALLDEAIVPERDAHGRVPAAATVAVRAGFADRPLVDEYAEILWWAISRLWPGLGRSSHVFSVRPTHDVDWPFYSRGRVIESVRAAFSDIAVRKNRSLARERIRALAAIKRRGRDHDPCNAFAFLMEASEQRGLTSAFYLMAGGTTRVYDPGYQLDDPWFVEVLRSIDARGHELGFHPSYDSYRDAAMLRRELAAVNGVLDSAGIGQRVAGGRQHFLRFENPTTWQNWDGAGLEYESTLGYAETTGFRCGTTRPYRVFDVRERRQLELVERPLIAMETAVLNYEQLSLDAAVAKLGRLRDVCRAFGGEFTFLWHNNRLVTASEREAYVAVLG